MTLPLTPRPDHPLEPTAAAKITSTQLFGVLYITLTGLVDSMVPNSGPWSLLGQSVSYIIKLASILWWALSASLAAPHPKCPNASTYDWLPDTHTAGKRPPHWALVGFLVTSPQSVSWVIARYWLRGVIIS
ncbi:hypothetical protein DSO57_1013576 [Entomophthora muscae]|uniref:Uncharacterized protein n=1 Tax=Entomophthora muscae TaxID=34485 RepID=A0ACC2S7Q2_9FUNG|nr:hypothetical protein DSO57_1013576 [Entomophthora muscae]